MSYILEALKKSKQERQGNEVPHLHVVHGVPAFKPRSRVYLGTGLFVGVAAIFMTVGAFVYLSPSEKTSPEVIDTSKNITVRKIEIRSQFFEQAEEDSVVVQSSRNVSASSSISKKTPQIIVIARNKVKKFLVDSSEDTMPSSATEEFILIKYRKELPPDIQREIPQFTFAGHTYADDPKKRMIIINNAILREGDSIDANTKLKNIVWEGVVLEYKGIMFKQKIH
ncbi:MAG: hypothetical protein ACI8ZB_003681 [Desulforhopalus sp.]|jgi:hypothetical protein